MHYQVTQQYTRDDERLVANFSELAEAKAYIADSLVANEQQRLDIVYRLFDRSLGTEWLLQEYNKVKAGALLHEAHYANGTRLLPATINQGYDVVQHGARVVASFCQLSAARAFALARVRREVVGTTGEIYQIMKNDRIVEEVSQASLAEADQRSAAGGKASTIAFRPTPLNTSPRPPGTPPSVIDVDEDA